MNTPAEQSSRSPITL